MPSDWLLYHPVFVKAPEPIELTDSGMVMELMPLQPEKALLPIELTDPGILIACKPLQPEKA